MRPKWKGLAIPYSVLFTCDFKLSLVDVDPKIAGLYIFSFKSMNWRKYSISEYCLGLSFPVHSGNRWSLIKITRNKVGFKFGSFKLTKVYPLYKAKKKKK